MVTNDNNTDSVLNQINSRNSLRFDEVPTRLHCAQQDLNQLDLINVCLQTTLFRIQNQLVDYLPENLSDEIQRNQTKQQLDEIRHNDDHVRRQVSPQQVSFVQMVKNVKTFFDPKAHESVSEETRLDKYEKQVLHLHEIFQELNTMIHIQHHDRICQLYLTLAQTSESVEQARQMVNQTVQAHRRLVRKRIRQRLILIAIVFVFLFIFILIIVFSIRRH